MLQTSCHDDAGSRRRVSTNANNRLKNARTEIWGRENQRTEHLTLEVSGTGSADSGDRCGKRRNRTSTQPPSTVRHLLYLIQDSNVQGEVTPPARGSDRFPKINFPNYPLDFFGQPGKISWTDKFRYLLKCKKWHEL